jgi:hypothetical protein
MEPARLDDAQLRAEHAYKVSKFLMRCIFAMFAEDMGFCPKAGSPADRAHRVRQTASISRRRLLRKMTRGGYNAAIQADIRRFNGLSARRSR